MKQFTNLFFALVLVASTSGLAAASQPPGAVVAAMEAYSFVVPSSIATPGSAPQMFDVRSSLGVISPFCTPTMGLLSTGNVNNITAMEDYDYPDSGIPDTSVGDHATLEFDMDVPTWANSLSFSFYFLTREYPEWVGSSYTDTFEANLTSLAYTGNVVLDALGNPITVNSALLTVTDPADLVGTGFDADGGTGWVSTVFPVSPGETLSLSLEVYDVADGVWDSAVLLDCFQFSTAVVSAPTLTSGSPDSDGDGSPDSLDCDPADPETYPGAPEFCDGEDNDCNGSADADPAGEVDADGDGDLSCSDCDDADPANFTGNIESCDGWDTDCNGLADFMGLPAGDDDDSAGDDDDSAGDDDDSASSLVDSTELDIDGDGHLECDDDCDDTDASINPTATEVCGNNLDDNCDGSIDENIQTFYVDTDGDSYGDVGSSTTACTQPSGYVTNIGDCDDTNAAINPGATEVCNDLDDNSEAAIDEVLALADYTTFVRDGDLADLFTSNESFASDASLASAYGVSPWLGGSNPPVPFPASQPRAGLLTRAALQMYGDFDSHPILKGARIRTEILCDELVAPADIATPEEAVVHPTDSTRELTEAITEIPGTACAGCHEPFINPVGFPSENFDALGRFRTEEILFDESGDEFYRALVETTTTPRLNSGDSETVDDAVDLSTMIATHAKTHECFARNYYRYEHRRMEVDSTDACEVNALEEALQAEGLQGMLKAAALLPEFKLRTMSN